MTRRARRPLKSTALTLCLGLASLIFGCGKGSGGSSHSASGSTVPAAPDGGASRLPDGSLPQTPDAAMPPLGDGGMASDARDDSTRPAQSDGATPPTQGDGATPPAQTDASTPSLVQVPVGAYVGTWLGDDGSQYYSSYSDHWSGFVDAMGGRVPTVVGLPGMPYPPTNPDQWPTQSQYNVSNWPSVLPKTTSPLLTIWYVDANSDALYSQAVDGTTYSGHDIVYWIQQTLQPYADFGVTKIYLRPAWEWNIAFMGQGIADGGAPTFVAAMQQFYTAAHAWGAANNVTVRVTWDPSVYGQATNGIPLAEQFPNQNPGDHYVDVICADFYAFGNSLATQPLGDPTVFTLTAIVAMSQQWNLPLGFCELGDGLFMNQDPTVVWLPNLINYLQTLSTASPPVPIEFMNLWDIQSIEWSPPQVNRADEAAGWKAALGTAGSLLTMPVP